MLPPRHKINTMKIITSLYANSDTSTLKYIVVIGESKHKTMKHLKNRLASNLQRSFKHMVKVPDFQLMVP